MKVPLLDLQGQLDYLGDDLLAAVTRVVQSTRYIQGPEVESLEQEIADYCGAKYGIGVTSGTDALLVSLMGLGIGPGDKVITTPFSFFATMGVILRLGAVPVFADIEESSFNIDPEEIEKLLQADTDKKTKAIIPVHLYGQCAGMDRIMEIARIYGIPVIEDAAQAIGAEYPLTKEGRVVPAKAGAMGLAGCFSFFPSKNLGGIGDGGMVVTQDEEFAKKLELLRNHGAFPKYYHKMVGGNFRLDPIQAAALRVKLPYLEKWHSQRRENASLYDQLLQDSGLVAAGKVTCPQTLYSDAANLNNPHIFNQYVLRVERRDALRDFLLANEVGCEIYYPVPLHKQECLAGITASVSCPIAEKAANETIALPIYPELSNEMQAFVVEKMVQFYR